MGNDELTRGVQDLWAEDEWRQRLAESSSKPLRIKIIIPRSHLNRTSIVIQT